MKTQKFNWSLNTKELIDGQNNETFCSDMLKLINDNRVPLDNYFVSDKRLLHKGVREDDKLFHVLVLPVALSKCIMH